MRETEDIFFGLLKGRLVVLFQVFRGHGWARDTLVRFPLDTVYGVFTAGFPGNLIIWNKWIGLATCTDTD